MNETTQLLQRWRDGEEAALHEVLTLHLPFIRQRVRELLGPALRTRLTSDDVVQDAVVDFLRNGPRFVPENGQQLQRLLGLVVAHTISDHGNWFGAARRRMANESSFEVQDLHGSTRVGDPVARAHDAEMVARLRLALELLDETDRRLIVWREWEKRPFAAIAGDLGLAEDGARAAWRRATERLRLTMAGLRLRGLDAVLDEVDRGSVDGDS